MKQGDIPSHPIPQWDILPLGTVATVSLTRISHIFTLAHTCHTDAHSYFEDSPEGLGVITEFLVGSSQPGISIALNLVSECKRKKYALSSSSSSVFYSPGA